MGIWRVLARARRGLAVLVLWVMFATLVAVTPGGPAAARAMEELPDWAEGLDDWSWSVPGEIPLEDSSSVEFGPPEDVSGPHLAEPVFPAAGRWVVPVDGAGALGSAEEGSGPPEVSVEVPGLAGEHLALEVFDDAVAERAGSSGFLFSLSPEGEDGGAGGFAGLAEASEEPVSGRLSVDYSGFATAFGGDFAARLELLAVPLCAVSDPIPAGCDVAGVRLDAENDLDAQELSVEIDDLAELAVAVEAHDPFSESNVGLSAEELAGLGSMEGGGSALVDDLDEMTGVEDQPVVSSDEEDGGSRGAVELDATSGEGSDDGADGLTFVVTSGASGETGTFEATDLSSTGDWVVDAGSGEFTYSYGVDVPEPPAGSAPAVGLSYSSGAVDGLTNASNTQAGMNGVGWSDFGGGFIERRYESCTDDLGTADLCFNGFETVTVSLNGATTGMMPLDEDYDQWQTFDDLGWRVERLSGADNGVWEGEYWQVTDSDGTRYVFGLGENPNTGGGTESAWGVPVVSTEQGDPCLNDDGSPDSCRMAWRWNLDHVVDPDGNVTRYYYYRHTNRYRAIGGMVPPAEYDRGGRLRMIHYGSRDDAGDGAAARVLFGAQYRCTDLDSTCARPQNNSNSANFPDVPVDLICESTSSCSEPAPTFFSTMRYSHVRAEVQVGGNWRHVEQHNLYHRHLVTDGPNNVGKLYLRSIQHAGVSEGGLMAYEHTLFGHRQLPNRVDVDVNTSPEAMVHWRINQVTNPFGGRTHVDYGQANPCEGDYNPDDDRWDQNGQDCFPQSILVNHTVRRGLFHKWLVTEIREDPRAGGTETVTSYDYEGEPAWAYDTGAFRRPDTHRAWSSWRGYATVTETQGSSVTRSRFYRGMNNDFRLVRDAGGNWCPCAQREVRAEYLDGEDAGWDEQSLAGRVIEQSQLGDLDGQADSTLHSTRYAYEHRETVPPGDDYLRGAEWADVASVTERVATEPEVFRERRTSMSYNDNLQLETTLEEGWLDVADDDRCARTTYNNNPDEWMYTYPSVMASYAGDCDSGELLARSETYYDGADELDTPPSRGNVTSQRAQLDAERWAEVTSTFDDLGRPVEVTDAEGNSTTTSYDAVRDYQLPIEVSVTNAAGHTASTSLLPEFGVPVEEVDPNGNVTSYEYDAFGRLENVWLPTEQPVDSHFPSWMFRYYPSSGERSIRSQQLTEHDDGVVYESGWVVYDGFWRERQTQVPSPEAGKVIVSDTTYDSRGMVHDETGAQAVTGTPGSLITGVDWENRSRNFYDELGRESRQEWWRGSDVADTTEFSYDLDTVTVTPSDGGPVRQRSDGLGRTVEVAEHDGDDWVASSYDYDLADNLVEITDPEDNETTYTYNMAGWRVTQNDPNRGSAEMSYDTLGNVTATRDAAGNEVHTIYDVLQRPVERRADSPEGELLVSRAYDAEGELGLPASETRHTPDGDWVAETLGYDGRDRPLGSRLTVPAGIPGLGGSYETTQTYDRADRVLAATVPAVGGLQEETVTTTFDDLGYARSMLGADRYVNVVDYDDRGRPVGASHGPAELSGFMLRGWEYDEDQRVTANETLVARDGQYQQALRHERSYTDGGDIASELTTMYELEWRECYDYDQRRQLVGAFTVESDDSCGEGDPGTGDRPYEHSYSYSPGGNMLERVEDGETFTYSYPDAGGEHPNAPTAVGDDTYDWDDAGRLVERTLDDESETFNWDTEGLLASVEADGEETNFVYDSGGARLLRETDSGATLYFAGHEVHASSDGSSVNAVRSYTFGGGLVATRTAGEGVSYMMGDQAGSVEAAEAEDSADNANRSYTPYGAVRSEEGEMATEQGFLGQIEDPSTNLSYLGARYYDTTTGLFISPDPLYDTDSPRTLNPYSYSVNDPVNYSDPDGLSAKRVSSLQGQVNYQAGVIRSQQNLISMLYTRIAVQQGIISYQRGLIAAQGFQIKTQQATINKLTMTVQMQGAIIKQQAAIIQVQAAVIRTQAAIIRVQTSIIRVQAALIRTQRGMLQKQAIMIRSQARVIATQQKRAQAQQATIKRQSGMISNLVSKSRTPANTAGSSSGGGGGGSSGGQSPIRFTAGSAAAPQAAFAAAGGSDCGLTNPWGCAEVLVDEAQCAWDRATSAVGGCEASPGANVVAKSDPVQAYVDATETILDVGGAYGSAAGYGCAGALLFQGPLMRRAVLANPKVAAGACVGGAVGSVRERACSDVSGNPICAPW